MTQSFAGVYLLDAPFAIDRVYDYAIPRALCDQVHRGSFVTVPFGNGNRKQLALVTELKSGSPYERIKPLLGVLSERVALSEHLLGLALFLKDQTLCTLGDAVRAMMPSTVLTHMTEFYTPTPDDTRPADPTCAQDEAVLQYLRLVGRETTQQLRARFGTETDDALRRLRERGLVVRDAEYEDRDKARYLSCHRLRVDAHTALALSQGQTVGDVRLRSDKQRAVLTALLSKTEPMPDKQLCEQVGCTASVLSALTQKGVLEEYKQPVERDPYGDEPIPPARAIELNQEQKEAYDTLCSLCDDGKGHGVLLHGVTGSGKTSVMLSLIAHLRKQGKGAIVLLPEIALTPQSIALFRAHFGKQVAVIHSALSAGERYDAHERIRRGEATVVLGTRSAVFAPVRALGAVIIDEEQEHTYKSDMNPKYRAHDVARYRCASEGAVMLLCSATPSLDSYYKAVQGTYTLLKLKKRFGGALLPEVIVADTRRETQGGNLSPLGSLLCGELAKNVALSQQSILFLNRRGYHRFVSCRSCGQALSCERCSVTMTYHTSYGDYSQGELVCHFCGARAPLPSACPACGSVHLTHGGFGTQRVEQELCRTFPDARVIRMDTDTTSTKFAYDRMLGEFRAHQADILLGTQMVTKGHDFPDVSLVGVLSADASLYLDDYRAAERTFAQLTQVIGRAGRSKIPGRAVIQTANPDHDVIRLACAQDYETFYEREIKLRRLLVFPPFCDLALLTLSSQDEKQLLLAATRLHEELTTRLTGSFSDVQTVVFGPFEAPVYRVDGNYRMRTVVKCRLNKRSRALFTELLCLFSAKGVGVQLSLDFNPSSL